MNLIQKAQIGTSKANREKLLREEIIHKFENVGAKYDENGNIMEEGKNWLAGLDRQKKINVGILYENQAEYLLTEATDTSSSGSFEVVAFPMIKRVFSKLLANEIVSVQAMTQPTGTLFYYYPKISERVVGTDGDGNETQSHTSPYAKKFPTCVGANCDDTTYENCKSLYDRFYNDALYDHSRGKFTIITATGQSVVALDEEGCAVTGSTYALANDGSYRDVIFSVTGFDGTNAGTSPGHTARLNGGKGLEIDTEEFLASFTVINAGDPILDPNGDVIYATGDEVKARLVAQRYGKRLIEYSDLCDANGNLLVELDLTHPLACTDCTSPDGYIGAASGTTFSETQFAFAWRKYDDLEWESEMGEVSFELEKVTVSAEPRKLRARWSPELAQDVAAFHAIDAEAELTALLSEQIAMEIDRQILRELKRGAAWKLRWNYYGWRSVGSQKYTQKEWNQTLITKINQLSAQIHKATLRGGANFLVVSAEASAIFDDLENFMVSTAAPADDKYNLGIRRIGTVSGRYTVYVDPYSRPNDVLVGHKGTSLLDTGYIYAPYVTAQLTPTLTDPDNFTNVKGIMHRAAHAFVNNRYYGLIFIDNVQTFDTRELR